MTHKQNPIYKITDKNMEVEKVGVTETEVTETPVEALEETVEESEEVL